MPMPFGVRFERQKRLADARRFYCYYVLFEEVKYITAIVKRYNSYQE